MVIVMVGHNTGGGVRCWWWYNNVDTVVVWQWCGRKGEGEVRKGEKVKKEIEST